MKIKKILVLILIFTLSIASVVYADVSYFELKEDLSDGNSTLENLNFNVLKMAYDVKQAELNSKSMAKRVEDLKDLPFSISSQTMAQLMYVRDIVPLQVEYGYDTLKSNRDLTENSFETLVRQLSIGVISSLDGYELAVEKYDFYKSEYEGALLKYDLGQFSQLDLLKSEVKFIEVEYAKDQAERKLEESYLNLNKFVGYDLDKKYDIEREEKFEIELKDPSYYLDYAFEYRFEIIDFERQIELQTAIADFYDYGDFLAFYPNSKARKDALLEKTKLEYDLELKKIEITEEIYSAISDLNIMSQQIDQLQNTLQLQENDYADLMAQVNQGYMTESAIKELEFAITNIKNNLDVMIYSYNTKHYELHNATFLGPAYGGGM